MLEKKNIDQLFLEKLKDYEKDPPVFLWNSIENEIHKVKENSNFRTVFAVAAAVIVIVLSGWWMTADRSDQKVLSKNISTKFHEPDQQKPGLQSAISEKAGPSTFAMAAFAAKPSPAYNKIPVKSEGDEPFPINVENNLFSRMDSEDKFMDKVAALLSLTNTDQNQPKLKTQHLEAKNTFEEHPERNIDLNKWSIGIQAGPMITGGLKSAEGLNTQAENTFSAGVMAGYKISKRFSVRSGILLNQVRQRSEFTIINPTEQSPGIITPSGIVNFNQAANSSISGPALKQQFNYLSVPLAVNYKIIDKKISLGVNAGISANFLTENKAELPDNNLNVKIKTADMRDVAWSGEVGLEIGYEIGKRITLTIEPHLKHYFQSLSSNSTINFKPIQAGLLTGISYSFN